METIDKAYIGELLERLYQSEIPARLEWVFDGGFVWSLTCHTKERVPRVWSDDFLGGDENTCATKEVKELITSPVIQYVDWLERGSEPTIEHAVTKLSEAVLKHFPNSDFTIWFQSELVHHLAK